MEFQKRYSRRGLTSIGVAMDEEGWKVVNPYLEQHPISYPVVVGDADFAKLFQIDSLPVTLLIDRNGRIADWHVGMVVKPGFSIWSWHSPPQGSRRALISAGSDKTNSARKGDTLWVRKNPSRSSSHSTAF
jgi:hypothetical protein